MQLLVQTQVDFSVLVSSSVDLTFNRMPRPPVQFRNTELALLDGIDNLRPRPLPSPQIHPSLDLFLLRPLLLLRLNPQQMFHVAASGRRRKLRRPLFPHSPRVLLPLPYRLSLQARLPLARRLSLLFL